ncbi:MAG: PorP/SprF family type IX secretion system membrane protein [Bacteroidetes bacterium]|nr:PorP/SprF family type IX secretion system membrane protein [Bacteroidota bacterium]
MKKTKKTLVTFALLSSVFLHAQDIHFSQFLMTPLLVNPAQAGSEYDMRGIANYKNQWGSVATPYSTADVSFDMKTYRKAKKGFSAVGVNVFNDKAGDAEMKTLHGTLAYAYHVYLSEKSTLGGGLYGGFAQRSINYANLQWMNQYDGSSYNPSMLSGEPAGGTNFTHLDLGGGLHYEYGKGEKYSTGNNHKTINTGIAMFHVNQPKYSFYGTKETMNFKTVAYVNANIGLSHSNISLVPSLSYFQQGKASELLMGTMIRYQLKEESKYTGYVKGSAISFGGYYRNKDAVIAMMLFEISQYAIGLSYDVNVSGLKSVSNGRGGFEISLRFVTPNPFLHKSASRI